MTLSGRRRGAGARVAASPRFLAREIAFFEEDILPRRRDPRVLVLVEDDLGLRRRARALVPVGSRAAAGIAARAAAGASGTTGAPWLVSALSISIEGVRVRLLVLTLHVVALSQAVLLVFLTGRSCRSEESKYE